ncbi:hypothetical protein FACS189427_13040 [Planctomycetales bacterium]|nr:hypothetical protein FACS189427_13040 [Planctomycetales bacterium]
MNSLKRFFSNVLNQNAVNIDNSPSKVPVLEVEAHLSVSHYGRFSLTEAVRPSFDLTVVPAEGYRREEYYDESTGGSIPFLMISVSAEKIFEVFLDLLQPLGGTVDAVIESSRLRKHSNLYREQIDLPVLTSYLLDYEHFLLNDGCTGIAVLNPALPAEVQWDEHKLLFVYAEDLTHYEQVLRKHSIAYQQHIRFISEAEHVHITRREYIGQFNTLRTLISAE